MSIVYKIILLMLFFLISGCSLIDTKHFNISNPDVKEVAQYNLYTLQSSVIRKNNYLLVNELGMARPKYIFIYINDIKHTLDVNRNIMQSLINYNKKVIAEINNN